MALAIPDPATLDLLNLKAWLQHTSLEMTPKERESFGQYLRSLSGMPDYTGHGDRYGLWQISADATSEVGWRHVSKHTVLSKLEHLLEASWLEKGGCHRIGCFH